MVLEDLFGRELFAVADGMPDPVAVNLAVEEATFASGRQNSDTETLDLGVANVISLLCSLRLSARRCVRRLAGLLFSAFSVVPGTRGMSSHRVIAREKSGLFQSDTVLFNTSGAMPACRAGI